MKKIEEDGIEYIVFEENDVLKKQDMLLKIAKNGTAHKVLEQAFNSITELLAQCAIDEAEMWKNLKEQFEVPEGYELSYNWVKERFTILPPKE